MRSLGLVVSPGRTGTVSVTRLIESLKNPKVIVHHERFKDDVTNPSRFFAAFEPARMAELASLPRVRELLDELDSLPDDVSYLETGWTMHPLVPLLLERFEGRVRLLHLTRHPVPTAASMTLHGLYDEVRSAGYGIEDHAIRPWSPGIQHPEVEAMWREMGLFERNLFRVVEIHRLGLRLASEFPSVPYKRIRVEEFSNDTARQILDFFELSYGPSAPVLPRTNETLKLARGARSVGEEWRRFLDYPWAVDLCKQLGYPIDSDAIAALEAKMTRYARRGALERFAGFVNRTGPLRRLWTGVVVPVRDRLRGTHRSVET